MLKFGTIILSLTLICFSSSAAFADLSGTLNSDYDLTQNESATSNTVSIDAQGHSINGNGFSGIKNTANSGTPVEIKNVGGFSLSQTTETTGDTILKFDNNGNVVRYKIKDTGYANGFINNDSSPASYKNYGSFVTSKSGLNIENSVIKNNTMANTLTGTIYGGAIYNSNSTNGLNIKNSYITGNHVTLLDTANNSVYGGAINADFGTTLSIIDSYITNNSINALGSSNTRGGAVYANNSSVIQNTYFGNNSIYSKSAQGAAMAMTNGVATYSHDIKNTIFENNTAYGTSSVNGGTLYLGGNVTIDNSLFLNNNSIVESQNGANSYGGTFRHFGSSTDLKVSNTRFEGNTLTTTEVPRANGGAVYLGGKDSTFENVNFTNNSIVNTALTKTGTESYGGAIFMSSETSTGNSKILTINKGSEFNGNSITNSHFAYGGAIGGYSGTNRYINIDDTTFINNFAKSTDTGMTGAMGGAIYNASNNILNINSSTFENNSSISAAQSASRKMGGGAIYNESNAIATVVDTSFKNNTALGTITVTKNATTSAQGGAILNNSGATLNVIALNKDVTFEGNKAGVNTNSLVSNAIYDYGGVINLNADENRLITFNDSIASSSKTTVLNINKQGEWENRDSSAPTGDNKIPIDAPTGGSIVLNNNMEGFTGDVNLYGGTLAIGQNGTFFNNAASFNVINPSSFNAANGVIQNYHLGNFNLSANLNLALDADLAQGTIDTLSYDSINVQNDAKINLERFNIITEATAESTSIGLDSYADIMDIITLDEGAKTALGKIYKYDVFYNEEENKLSFNRSGTVNENEGNTSNGNNNNNSSDTLTFKDVNPAVMAAAVAAQAGYYTQLNSYNQAFQNTLSKMMLPKLSRNASKNRYAIAEDKKFYFEDERNNAYFRPYTTFEKVGLKGGVDVSNVMYGTFMGTDSRVFELKNGKRAQLSGYLAYNGSHQSYSGNSLYQNGGTIGATGSLYKNNFFTALTANVGASVVSASTMYGNEDFPMLMTGVASKSGYNFEMKEGRFVIQPNFLM